MFFFKKKKRKLLLFSQCCIAFRDSFLHSTLYDKMAVSLYTCHVCDGLVWLSNGCSTDTSVRPHMHGSQSGNSARLRDCHAYLILCDGSFYSPVNHYQQIMSLSFSGNLIYLVMSYLCATSVKWYILWYFAVYKRSGYDTTDIVSFTLGILRIHESCTHCESVNVY